MSKEQAYSPRFRIMEAEVLNREAFKAAGGNWRDIRNLSPGQMARRVRRAEARRQARR